MAWKSIVPEFEIDDAKQDAKNGVRIQQFTVTDRAVYIPPGRYLPIRAIRRVWIQDTQMPLTGCCGRAIPMSAVRMEYADGVTENLRLEKKENAEKLMELIEAHMRRETE